MRDLVHNLAAVTAVDPAVLSATTTSAALDLLGCDSAMFLINTGAIIGAGDFTAKVQDSDTTTSGDFIDVPAARVQGVLPASLAASSTAKVGYRGFKRYVRLVITKNSGTSIAAGAMLIKGNAADKPVA